MLKAEQIIKKMGLSPLPEEGGYYLETYRSDYGSNDANVFGVKAEGKRDLTTAIYYLVSKGSFSAMHRITSDEIFHFYAGSPIEMLQVAESGELTKIIMGSDVMLGHSPQVVVPRGVWQGLRLIGDGEWALMGTTVSPGFEFQDFEVGERDKMLKLFPQYKKSLLRFTRDKGEKVHE